MRPLGSNYIVKNGKVVAKIDNMSVVIPEDGYVVYIYGSFGDIPNRFAIGNVSSYDATIIPQNGNQAFWSSVEVRAYPISNSTLLSQKHLHIKRRIVSKVIIFLLRRL